MWMPLRSVRMKRLTFGFHRRVWCPKWTPLSSSWRMVTTAMAVLLFWRLRASFGCSRLTESAGEPGARHTPARSCFRCETLGVDAALRPSKGWGADHEGRRALGTRSHPDERGARPSVSVSRLSSPVAAGVRSAHGILRLETAACRGVRWSGCFAPGSCRSPSRLCRSPASRPRPLPRWRTRWRRRTRPSLSPERDRGCAAMGCGRSRGSGSIAPYDPARGPLQRGAPRARPRAGRSRRRCALRRRASSRSRARRGSRSRHDRPR